MKYLKCLLFFLSLKIFNEIKSISAQSSNFYTKSSEFNNFDLGSSFLLKFVNSISNLKCFSICEKMTQCSFIIYQNKRQRCFICKKNLTLFMNYKPDGISLIYQKQFKFKQTNGLINYWSFNGNVDDEIGHANLSNGVNAALTSDRFGTPDSALSLKDGYYNVPPGVYFSGTQLTIMAWVKVRTFRLFSRLIDFGNGAHNENIVVGLTRNSSGISFLHLRSDINFFTGLSTKALNLNQWQHLSCVYSFPFYYIYIDGIEVTISESKTVFSSFSLANVTRISNFIGRSNFVGQLDADADFDDIKLFNRALNQNEIRFEMNNNA